MKAMRLSLIAWTLWFGAADSHLAWADPSGGSPPVAASPQAPAPKEQVGTLELTQVPPSEGALKVPAVTSVEIRNGSVMRSERDHGPIYLGDRIATRADQSVAIRLNDQSLITIAPASDVTIDQFALNKTSPSVQITLERGLTHVVVPKGVYNMKQPFIIRTKTATMGVRGTDFLVEQTEGGDATLHTLDGAVAIAKTPADLVVRRKIQMVAAGQMSSMGPKDSLPAAPKQFNRKTVFGHLGTRAPALYNEIEHQAQIRRAETRRVEEEKRKKEGKQKPKKKKKPGWKPHKTRKPVNKK